MANGTLDNIRGIKISQIDLGTQTISSTSTGFTKTFTSPDGYKRYIADVHIASTTDTNYKMYSILWNPGDSSITIHINRPSGLSNKTPYIRVTAIDVPLE